MSRSIVQLHEARQVFANEADALDACAEVRRTLAEPKHQAFRDLAGGIALQVVRDAGGGWYVMARRNKSRQLVGYVGHAYDDADDLAGGGCGGVNDAEDPTWY